MWPRSRSLGRMPGKISCPSFIAWVSTGRFSFLDWRDSRSPFGTKRQSSLISRSWQETKYVLGPLCRGGRHAPRGQTPTYDDLEHHSTVVAALSETIRLKAEIDVAIPKWPLE